MSTTTTKESGFFGLCEEIPTKKTASEMCASAASHENWLADTGATAHITMEDDAMVNVKPVNIAVVVYKVITDEVENKVPTVVL